MRRWSASIRAGLGVNVPRTDGAFHLHRRGLPAPEHPLSGRRRAEMEPAPPRGPVGWAELLRSPPIHLAIESQPVGYGAKRRLTPLSESCQNATVDLNQRIDYSRY